MGSDTELLCEVVDAFLGSYQVEFQNLMEAIDKGRPADVERCAHTLKSMFQNFFHGRLVDLSFALECAGRDPERDVHLMHELRSQLEQELADGAELIQCIQQLRDSLS